MSKKKKIIVSGLVLVLILGVFWGGFYFLNSKSPHPDSIKIESSPLLSKERGQGGEVSFEYKMEVPISVYDFMRSLKTEGKITFEEKNYPGMGIFIESLNGIKNNGDKNWIYYVNGVKAGVGISNYKLNAGDTVTWKYENSY